MFLWNKMSVMIHQDEIQMIWQFFQLLSIVLYSVFECNIQI